MRSWVRQIFSLKHVSGKGLASGCAEAARLPLEGGCLCPTSRCLAPTPKNVPHVWPNFRNLLLCVDIYIYICKSTNNLPVCKICWPFVQLFKGRRHPWSLVQPLHEALNLETPCIHFCCKYSLPTNRKFILADVHCKTDGGSGQFRTRRVQTVWVSTCMR